MTEQKDSTRKAMFNFGLIIPEAQSLYKEDRVKKTKEMKKYANPWTQIIYLRRELGTNNFSNTSKTFFLENPLNQQMMESLGLTIVKILKEGINPHHHQIIEQLKNDSAFLQKAIMSLENLENLKKDENLLSGLKKISLEIKGLFSELEQF